MDYNDSDYEGHNLHLAGEESSKISVLRPFALPKFDFDDSLHGHLRFDSLVENEVFLGIPSQEDNHWIEDFSRGGNGIEFSSSAAETCALPRHINVWSEATSSESVEMLLKAVGQEEMVPGENMIEESDPGNQLSSSTIVADDDLKDAPKVDNVDDGIPSLPPVGQEEMVSGEIMIEESGPGNQLGSSTIVVYGDLRDAHKVDDIDDGIPSSPPAEVVGISFRANQTSGIESDHIECTLEVQETSFSSHGVDIDNNSSLTVATGNSSFAVNSADNNQGETDGLVDRFISHQMQEDLPVSGKELDSTKNSQNNMDVNARHLVDQDIISSINFSSSCTVKSTSNPVEEQNKGCNEYDARLSEISHGTDDLEKYCSHETTSNMPSQKQEHGVDSFIASAVEVCDMQMTEESVTHDDACNNVASVVEPAECTQHSTVPGPEIKQLSETDSMLHERSSVVPQGEGIEGLGIGGNDAVPPVSDGSNEMKRNEMKQGSLIQSPERLPTLVGNEGVSPQSRSSLEALCAASGPTMLQEELGNPDENDHDHKTDDASGDSGKSIGSTVCGECSEKLVADAMEDAKNTPDPQKENVEDGEHLHPPLVGESLWTCKKDIVPKQVDALESDVNVSAHEKGSEKLSLDSHEMVFGGVEKVIRSTCPSGVVEVQKTTGSKSDSSVGIRPGLNAEDEGTSLAALHTEGDQLVYSCTTDRPSSDMEHKDHSRETESEAPKHPSSSAPKELLDKNGTPPVTEINKDAIPASVVELTKTSHQSVSLLETSSLNMPDESSAELGKMVEHPVTSLVAQNDDIEATPSKDQTVAEVERDSEGSLSKLSVTSSTVENDKSNKDAATGASDFSQSETAKQISQTLGVQNVPCKEDETFTFDTRSLGGQATEDSGEGLQSFQTGEGFPAVSVSSQTDPVIETSHVGSSTPGVFPASGGVGTPSERKPRRGGNRSGKGSSKKGNLVKETSPLKQTEKGDKSSSFFSPLGAGQLMTFDGGVKPRGAISIPTSSLPDLNTSAPSSSSSFFQQPFTDLQQVQLRAQIFVYGSLIQGAAPDEACMISAFGTSDGGRSPWERSWRACAERFQKSQGNNTGTPLPARSDAGFKATDQTYRQDFSQSEVLSSTAGRQSIKGIPSPVNSAIPLSSPLWNISTPSLEALPQGSMARSTVIDYQSVSPLNPYQTPPIRNYIPHSTWPAQAPAAPFPVPWLASSQSSPFEISTSYPAFPIPEPVKLTAVKESSPLPVTSGINYASPISTTNTGATAMIAGASSLDLKKVKASTGQSGDAKTRKRKKPSGPENVVQITAPAPLSDAVSVHAVPNQLSNKASAAEDLSRISFLAQSQVGLMPTPVFGSYYSTSAAVPASSSFVPKSPSSQALSVVTPLISSGHLSKSDINMDKKAFIAEGFSKVAEAKLQAQEAAAHAAAAISHCEGVWSHLDLQKSSGLASDAESKLASAAAAIAAAASVAKAAAAAAKIAADAAVQAKQMADEALIKSGTSTTTTEYDSSVAYNSLNLADTSSLSILKGGERNNTPSLVISAAREAARKRIEAASAATRHAENLDAILKAAELAAEAVAHAGKVVAMGDPFSLSALAEAGPSNYWKVPQVACIPGSKSSEVNKNKSISNNAAELPSVYNQHEGPHKDVCVTSHYMSPTQRELSKETSDRVTIEENFVSCDKHGEKSSELHNDKKVSDSITFVASGPDAESGPKISTTSMREGSLVEVRKDCGDSKIAWFSANVLSLKDGEALVCYDGLQSDDGSEQLKEWISIEAKDGGPPRIRVPHPMTGMQLEGTRKRRRAAVKDYNWSVGDQVDAWVHDCWRECTITEKNKKDATSLSVHFPAQGETLAVKVWHLRPSLVWSDGEWIEWFRPQQDGTHQRDTPAEKRPKLGSTTIEAKGKLKMAKNIDFAEAGGNEEPKLPLSAKEKVFNIGSTREENKLNTARVLRSGLEKEGSRVVFGVPKPGKKRKFMEVSKHYVSDRISKNNVPNDSVKLSKFLVPQGSGSRVVKNSSKHDSKEKQVADSKPRPLKSGKPPSIPSRTLARRDDSTSSRSNARDTASSDHIAKGSTSNDENESSEQNLAEVDQAPRGAMEFHSRAPPQGSRKKAVRNIKSERLHQGKPSRQSAKDEATENLVSEVSEPRRSNRRIQPTSRLLEGLQSSLIISKIPSSSHDKMQRSHNKGMGRGSNDRG